jgi:hypothetical protein
MKRFVPALTIGMLLAFFVVDHANAIVCARGVYRAGCVGAHGAVGVHRYGYGYHRGVVVRRRVY